MKFVKYHGLGNDFVLVDARKQAVNKYQGIAKKVCDRNFGIGADGLILVLDSEKADLKMLIFNADASIPEMCGNGIRCFVKFVFEELDFPDQSSLSVETGAGVLDCFAFWIDGELNSVKVQMGRPWMNKEDIPMLGKGPSLDQSLELEGMSFDFSAISMGNPHMIIFDQELERGFVEEWGSKLTSHKLFPKGANIEFCQKIKENTLEMMVFERGCGITLACGTGACATAVAYAKRALVDTGKEVEVLLLGGSLWIEVEPDFSGVWMRGPAEKVFSGELFT